MYSLRIDGSGYSKSCSQTSGFRRTQKIQVTQYLISSVTYLINGSFNNSTIRCAHLIAQYIGRKRQIGYGKSVFWSILFSPVIGILVTLSSRKIEKR